jgi:uncharacterized 2Fe-2S/4Fe-4S cluster protein (DUF4445 family)
MPSVTFLPGAITVQVAPGVSLLDAARTAGLSVETPCGGMGTCGKCRATLVHGSAGPLDDGPAFVAGQSILVCRTRVAEADVTLEIAPRAPQAAGQFAETAEAVPIDTGLLPSAADIDPLGSSSGVGFGIAVDVGTTTVAVQLVDLQSGAAVATATDYNGQIPCGLDVISRINYARRPEGLADLSNRILQTINGLVRAVCRRAGVELNEVRAATISGNTTMTHLLLGLPPESIRIAPYEPLVLAVPALSASDAGLEIHPEAVVRCSPAIGSYVGGDITAGLLCTGLAAGRDHKALFIDVGTNGELVVGVDDVLLACACSAGPAFEGGGMESGMRACAGAVDRVSVDPHTGAATCRVIGGAAPLGICGSGMISLVAELARTGWMDRGGQLTRERACSSIVVDGRRAWYRMTGSGEEALRVSESDIANLLRAKAAIYAATMLLLEQVDLRASDVERFYIAGGFGRYLDIEDAITIGMLPDIECSRYCYLGNASLAGTAMTLVSRRHRELQESVARRMTYLTLDSDPAYMDQYTAALFVPHTDLGRFPSVAGCSGLSG